MISDKCKERCCVFLVYNEYGCYCNKRKHGLDYEDDEEVNCDFECYEHEIDDND